MIHTMITLAASGPESIATALTNPHGLWALTARFGLNLLVLVILVRYFYYSVTRRKDYLFTYLVIGSVIFLLCYLLDSVELQIGFALGLFAVFGIIRYRTNPIPIREMTYLFLIIALSVINALANIKVNYAELLFTNLAIVLITFLLEKVFLLKHESSKIILYEKIELIKPSKREELLKDLEERTGITINRIEIGRINFLRDTARIKIFYYEPDGRVHDNDEFYLPEDDVDV